MIKSSSNKALFNWSGGKDSALALYYLLQAGELEVATLFTTVNAHYRRISMHGVREELLERQAKSLGLPVTKLYLPEAPSMPEYEQAMGKALRSFRDREVAHAVFGDIFLEDLKNYRVKKLREAGMEGVFPLWKRPTQELVAEFIRLGFKTIVVCVDERYLDKSFAGRVIDKSFLEDLPEGVDPCGENGEFHTFVYDGPLFSAPVAFEKGEVVYRRYGKRATSSDDVCGTGDVPDTGFWYMDLLSIET